MSSPKKKNSISAYAVYSTLVIQMGAIITASAYAGQWLDGRLETNQPLFTMGASLFAVLGSLYWIFKRFTSMNNDGE